MRLMPGLLLLALLLCFPVYQGHAADEPGIPGAAGRSTALTSQEFLLLLSEPLDSGDLSAVIQYIKGNPQTALQTVADLRQVGADTVDDSEGKLILLQLADLIESLLPEHLVNGRTPETSSRTEGRPQDICQEQYETCIETLIDTCMDQTFPAACIDECVNKYGFSDNECRNDLCLPDFNVSAWRHICADRVKEKSKNCDERKNECDKKNHGTAPE